MYPFTDLGEYTFKVHFFSLKDLNRQIVQTNYATVSIPKLEFEVPPNKGGKKMFKIKTCMLWFQACLTGGLTVDHCLLYVFRPLFFS